MDLTDLQAAASIVIAAPSDALYEFVADMPRAGEVSPVCTGGEWETDARGVGATFIGTNTMGERTWQARMKVAVADAPREFAWENIGAPDQPLPDDVVAAARWTYTFTPVDGGTRVDESWRMLLSGPQLEAIGEERLKAIPGWNQAGMETTLANLKALFEDTK
jgi:polyketide cyclase/dehydrase/lipid transport protein